MDAIQLLTLQHRAIEDRMKRMAGAPESRWGAMLIEIGDHLGEHLASEEAVFYPAVRERRTEDVLLESLEEHLSLKRLLADLLQLPPEDATFEAKFKVLKEQTEHHHREEEEHLFPKVLRLLDAGERDVLGRRMVEMQQQMAREGDAREVMAGQIDRAAPLE